MISLAILYEVDPYNPFAPCMTYIQILNQIQYEKIMTNNNTETKMCVHGCIVGEPWSEIFTCGETEIGDRRILQTSLGRENEIQDDAR